MTRKEAERYSWILKTLTAKAKKSRKTVYVAEVLDQLLTCERALTTIGVRQCSEEMSEREETRLEKREEMLKAKCTKLAAELGAKFYHQSDPRGCQVYIYWQRDLASYNKRINETKYGISSCYPQVGVAVCL